MTDACTYVIFGATGNLSQVKLMPALYHLETENRLPSGTVIVCSGRRELEQADWAKWAREMVAAKARGGIDETAFSRFRERLFYFRGDLNNSATYRQLKSLLSKRQRYPGNVAFYMSIRPAEFGVVTKSLSAAGLLDQSDGWRQVVIEKPFGYDLPSAKALQDELSRYLREDQLYRIDHYLGKGTVQNVLVFRFANVTMEPIWNRHYIDHVQITLAETVGVGDRADYYDGAGALRDMIQSHLLQLLTLVAMEPPASMEAESLRDEKVKVLKSIRPIADDEMSSHAFRSQYNAGEVEGKPAIAYVDEKKVPAGTNTETYAALKLYIDNWRWRGVPFYLQTGKRLKRSQSLISICFRPPPLQFFKDTQVQQMLPNWVLLGIQPIECLRMEVTVKEPGLEMKTRLTSLDAGFRNEDELVTDAYEDLLLDVIEGDRSLFLRLDEVEYAWRVVDPVLNTWAEDSSPISTYPAGTWGPVDAKQLFDHQGYWRHSLDPWDSSTGDQRCSGLVVKK